MAENESSKTRGRKSTLKKKLKKAGEETQERRKEPGVVYIGRLPWGLEEKGLRDYFAQFGNVVDLRLARSGRTGNSKGYAFVKFSHDEVAKIVAETMDNYLMFGKLIVCRHITDVHPTTFKGSKGPFKPRFRERFIANRNAVKTDTKLEDEKQKVLNGYLKKVEKLKELGIEFRLEDMEQLKSDIEAKQKKQEENPMEEEGEADETDSEQESEEEVKKKPKKNVKAKDSKLKGKVEKQAKVKGGTKVLKQNVIEQKVSKVKSTGKKEGTKKETKEGTKTETKAGAKKEATGKKVKQQNLKGSKMNRLKLPKQISKSKGKR